MDEKLNIDKNSPVPLYQQLVLQITAMIERGALQCGDKLWPERALADSLGLSRGTVTTAYNVLKRDRVITSKMGGNNYVQGLVDSDHLKKQDAMDLINKMLDTLFEMGFSFKEYTSLINFCLIEREQSLEKLKVAVIECRKEALIVFERQLAHINNVEFSFFLVDEIDNIVKEYGDKLFESFDLVITTSTHYHEVCKKIPSVKAKTREAVVAWDRKTIFGLASINPSTRIGVLYNSYRFVELVKNALNYFNLPYASLDSMNEDSLNLLPDFLQGYNMLIAEPSCPIFNNPEWEGLVETFSRTGGKIVCFDHYIERGSLIYIEESISAILVQKAKAKAINYQN